jgi:hypothetical protein
VAPPLVQRRSSPAGAGSRRWPRQHAGDATGSTARHRSRLPRSETELVLQPGTTLILFTDGLVERRGQVIDCIRLLSTTLTDLGPPALRDPESLCGELFGRLLPDSPEDDVGLLVGHLTTPTDLPIGRPFPPPGVMAGGGVEQSEVSRTTGAPSPAHGKKLAARLCGPPRSDTTASSPCEPAHLLRVHMEEAKHGRRPHGLEARRRPWPRAGMTQ